MFNCLPSKGLVVLVLAASLFAIQEVGAQQYDLIVPSSGLRSTADISAIGLTITDSRGTQTIYTRDRRYDSADGRYIGFFSRSANQIIGFPAAERGSMMIGRAGIGGVNYRASQMQVQKRQAAFRPAVPPVIGGVGGIGASVPMGGTGIGSAPLTGAGVGAPSGGTLHGAGPGFGNPLAIGSIRRATYLRLTSADAQPVGFSLGIGRGATAAMKPSVASEVWQIVPLGAYYRVQCYVGGNTYSLAVAHGSLAISLEPARQDSRQLWHVSAIPGNPNAVTLESVYYPGRMLAGGRDGLVGLERYAVANAQVWLMQQYQPPAAFVPSRRLVNHEIRANPPIPVTVQLANPHRRQLWALIQDRRPSGQALRAKVDPGQAVPVRLERDGGATLIETYEVVDAFGRISTQSFQTTVPPESIYDVSVYELIAQSISIDRTRRGGGRIDDTNYQPKSLGYFRLPAELQPVQMDIYAQAKEAGNPGGVRRIDPRKWTSSPEPLDPVERMLQDRGFPN